MRLYCEPRICVSSCCGLDQGLKLNSNPESEFYGLCLFQVYLVLVLSSWPHTGGLLSSSVSYFSSDRDNSLSMVFNFLYFARFSHITFYWQYKMLVFFIKKYAFLYKIIMWFDLSQVIKKHTVWSLFWVRRSVPRACADPVWSTSCPWETSAGSSRVFSETLI